MKEIIWQRTTKITFFLCLIIGISTAMEQLAIDDFSLGFQSAGMTILSSPPLSVDSFFTQYGTDYSNLMGGSRDIALTINNGLNGCQASTGAKNYFYCQFGSNCTGFCLLQYDGSDNSMNVNTKGFTDMSGASTGVNFLLNNGNAFNITYQSNIETLGFIYVYDIYTGLSFVQVRFENFDATNEKNYLIVPFDVFNGVVNFAHVGAVEIYITALENINFFIYNIATISF